MLWMFQFEGPNPNYGTLLEPWLLLLLVSCAFSLCLLTIPVPHQALTFRRKLDRSRGNLMKQGSFGRNLKPIRI